jgi:hypothetical protein
MLGKDIATNKKDPVFIAAHKRLLALICSIDDMLLYIFKATLSLSTSTLRRDSKRPGALVSSIRAPSASFRSGVSEDTNAFTFDW